MSYIYKQQTLICDKHSKGTNRLRRKITHYLINVDKIKEYLKETVSQETGKSDFSSFLVFADILTLGLKFACLLNSDLIGNPQFSMFKNILAVGNPLIASLTQVRNQFYHQCPHHRSHVPKVVDYAEMHFLNG